MTPSSATLIPPAQRKPRRSFPEQLPFYYGWVMLPVTMIAHVSTFPGQTSGVAVFNSSFREALDLNHSQLTGVYMLGSFLACLPMFAVGTFMDRYGIRKTMSVVVVLFGAACIFTSLITNLLTLGIAFFMLRTLGQGALALLSDNTLAMWFRARLGTVSGLKGLSWALALAVLPGFILWLINSYGWRGAYAISGIIVWVTMLPLLAFVFRNRPEDIGQVLDGQLKRNGPGEASETKGQDSSQEGMQLGDAMRHRAYWITLGISATASMIGTGIFFNMFPLFESYGRSRKEVVVALSLIAISMAVMQLVGGLLADRIRLNCLMPIAVMLFAGGLALLLNSQHTYAAMGFALLYGAGEGLQIVVAGTIWAKYFGRAHLGKIRSSVWMTVVAASSVGPFILGATYDRFGRFCPALWLFLLVYVVFVIAAFFATPPPNSLSE